MQDNPAYMPGPFSTTVIDCSRNNAAYSESTISNENLYDLPQQIDPTSRRTVRETHEHRKCWCSCLVTILLVSMMVMVIAFSLSIWALVMQQQIRSDIEALQGLLKVSIQPSSQNSHQFDLIANTATPETIPIMTSSPSAISEPSTTTVDQIETTTTTEPVTAGTTTVLTTEPSVTAGTTALTTEPSVTAGTTALTTEPSVTAGTTALTTEPSVTAGTTALTTEPSVTAGTTALTMDPTTITTTIESTTPSMAVEHTTTEDISSSKIGTFLNPASSCSDISQDRPPDYYWVRLPNGRPDTKVYCDTTPRECSNNVTSMRVAHIDMRNLSQQCPNEFTTHIRNSAPFRLCGKLGTVSCVSTTFSTYSIEYSRVFGRVIGYQFDRPDAFRSYDVGKTIEDLYVGGVSLTHGEPPKHIWTFAGARDEVNSDGQRSSCPCIKSQSTFTYSLPAFIGQDYFCDTGSQSEVNSGTFYQADPLWDGEGCGGTSTCCELNNPPWFCKELPQPTTDPVKLRLCADEDDANEGTPLEIVEIFVV